MAGVIIAAYELDGWPRIALLTLGSILLFALTIETIKKRLHMNAMSILLKTLQEDGLKLAEEHRFPVGVSDDIGKYLYDWEQKQMQKNPDAKIPDSDDGLFQFFKNVYARKFLTWTVFIAAIIVAVLADFEFVTFLQYGPYFILVGIVFPLIISGVLLIKIRKTNIKADENMKLSGQSHS
jgi:hypothetical protein